jgi:dipeptidyl aminopeptidase/acylaminoacyl peptidase
MAALLGGALLGTALLALQGCSEPTSPAGSNGAINPDDELQILEGSINWSTNSVSWMNENEHGTVPEDRYALISIAQQADLNGPSHFLYQSSIYQTCLDLTCLPGGQHWVSAEWTILNLDWSPVGSRVVFEGRRRVGTTTEPSRVTVMAPDGSTMQLWENGLMPSFSRSGAQIVFVAPSKQTIRLVNADTGLGGDLVTELASAEYPRLSPGDSLVAFSAQHGAFGRRIFVVDAREPDFFPRPASDPDDITLPSRDGIGDNFPTWSPSGRHLAYVSTVTRTSPFRDAIFIASLPGAEVDTLEKIYAFEPGQRVTYLRWHPGGRYMLLIIQNNAYRLVVPERYRQ